MLPAAGRSKRRAKAAVKRTPWFDALPQQQALSQGVVLHMSKKKIP
jgi:hypothetical protein